MVEIGIRKSGRMSCIQINGNTTISIIKNKVVINGKEYTLLGDKVLDKNNIPKSKIQVLLII